MLICSTSFLENIEGTFQVHLPMSDITGQWRSAEIGTSGSWGSAALAKCDSNIVFLPNIIYKRDKDRIYLRVIFWRYTFVVRMVLNNLRGFIPKQLNLKRATSLMYGFFQPK